jgi:hypothetical protein
MQFYSRPGKILHDTTRKLPNHQQRSSIAVSSLATPSGPAASQHVVVLLLFILGGIPICQESRIAKVVPF